jgi:glyoxylase-like metal-dependent hydrolase (beta-lactamase superfamily II)
MEIRTLAEGFLGANCYLLSSGGHALIVDPAARLSVICDALNEDGLTLDGILLTHGHFDHVMTLAPLLERFPVPVYLGEGDREFPSDGRKNAFTVFFGQERTFPDATDLLCDGDRIPLGEEHLTVIATPGHSGGSVCYLYAPTDGTPFLLTGDTLFADNVGRTDLYGGSYPILRDSLAELQTLANRIPDAVIYPGHGASERFLDAIRSVTYP